MSRIGRMPIPVPSGVKVDIAGDSITVTGPKGALNLKVSSPIEVKEEEGNLVVTRPDDERDSRALHGLTRTLVSNMVTGVTTGFEKTLEIVGTGYRVAANGTGLEFQLGYSHPILFPAPEGITFKVESPTKLIISGIDKQLVGETAAKVKKLRKADPYKGKGLRLEGEVVRRKAGKAGKK